MVGEKLVVFDEVHSSIFTKIGSSLSLNYQPSLTFSKTIEKSSITSIFVTENMEGLGLEWTIDGNVEFEFFAVPQSDSEVIVDYLKANTSVLKLVLTAKEVMDRQLKYKYLRSSSQSK